MDSPNIEPQSFFGLIDIEKYSYNVTAKSSIDTASVIIIAKKKTTLKPTSNPTRNLHIKHPKP